MKKYNKDKRARYKLHTRRLNINDKCDAQNVQNKIKQIHININYDGYNRIEYMPIIFGKTRNNKAQKYINITNTINDIFPDINAPHNAHIYRAIAPYIPTAPIPPYTRPEYTEEDYGIFKYTDTKSAKCIIFNAQDEVIYYGIIRRTIKIYGRDAIIYLHKGERTINVRPYIPLMDEIKGVSIDEIRAHGVELYHI